jgi:hypothetical protein
MAITYEPIATTTLGTALHHLLHFLLLVVVIQTWYWWQALRLPHLVRV